VSVEVDLEMDLEGSGGVFAHIGRKLRVAVETACVEGAEEAVRVHPYTDRTGRLTRSIRGQLMTATATSAEGEIVALAEYASFVENGTRPHRIEARNAQALRWEGSDGTPHFAKSVNHPGTKPYPFMGPGHLKAERVLEREINVIVAEAERQA
jgi:hypothetical protein